MSQQPDDDFHILCLNKEEAEVIRTLLGNVLGSFNGPRGVANDFYYCLGNEGVRSLHPTHVKGIITLPDDWDTFRSGII